MHVRSGNGGAGCVSFRREKHVEFGGPDGGNGGRGGDVIVTVDPQRSTLLDYKFKPKHFAENGCAGEGNQCSGRDGKPVILYVPKGTVVYNDETDEVLADLCDASDSLSLLTGGRGGKGNEHFKSSTRQAPRFAQPGEDGAELSLRLELKLLADVGLIGMPSVGKSSLISRISAAKPKIADYPFTTLTPNLGVVQFGIAQHYVVADVPGLIPGAHEGAGLGSRFLRHVERVSILVHLITITEEEPGRDPIVDFECIERELALHEEELTRVTRILELNRMDLPHVAHNAKTVADYASEKDLPYFAVSAATGEGLVELVNYLGEVVSRHKENESSEGKFSAHRGTLKRGD